MKSANYTIWGIFLRVVLILWPIYLIQSAWYEGSLIKLIAAIVVLLLIVCWAVSYIIRFYKQGKDLAAQREAAFAKAQEEKALMEIQRAEEQERRENWENTHGRLTTKIAGVTFRNDDGSSRQKYLKEAFVNQGDGTIKFESYEYQGEPAIRVFYDDMCIGNIPKDRVQDVMDVIDRITAVRLDVERFCPDDEDARPAEIIYRADVIIVYSKI